MATLLQFPKIHRKEMLLDELQKELIESFIDKAKQLNLTLESIRDLPPIPRSAFTVTQAALLLAEKRGELPQPIVYNGKFCYSTISMVEKALSRFYPHRWLIDSQARHVAMACKFYSEGDPQLLMILCYSKRRTKAEQDASFRELVLDSPPGDFRDFGMKLLRHKEVVSAFKAYGKAYRAAKHLSDRAYHLHEAFWEAYGSETGMH